MHARLLVDDLLDAREEPGVVSCRTAWICSSVDAVPHGLGDHAGGGRASGCDERGADRRSCRRRGRGPSSAMSSKPVRPVSSERSAFCRLSAKVRPIAIASPTDFIAVVSVRLGAGELLEGEARDLGDDVVDGRLEGGGRGAAGDVVVELVERVADGELGGDLGDREAGGLGGQRRGARHARVHLDDDEAAVGRVDRELHVGAAGLDADLAQHRDRGVAHDLVFLVGQRQRRRDGDRVAGVHAHRVDVLDGADDDAVVRLVADHLHLELLPAEHALLDQHLARPARRRGRARRSRSNSSRL